MPAARSRCVLWLLGAATSLLLIGGATAVPASAAPAPAIPSGVRLANATETSLTVSASPATYATGYRLFASTTRSSVYVANISKARSTAVSSKPTVTLSGLTYSTAAWHFRFAAVNAQGTRYSAIFTGYLRPPTPAGLRVRSATSGTSLTWTNGGTLGYRIAQATDPTMTRDRVNYTTRSRTRQFTPYGLRRGTRYYFHVAALNGATRSRWSAQVSAVAVPREQQVRVMTYNILGSTTAGVVQGDGPLATWEERRTGVARLIRSANPDLVALQEGNGWVGSPQGYGGTRQVDDLRSRMTDPYGYPLYGLARTEVPPTQRGYLRTGRYILYKKSAYQVLGTGGYWNIGSGATTRHAAYQVLQHRASGARLLFVSAHLSPLSGATGDTERQNEATNLINMARSYASSAQLPIVYAGDFNTHEGSNHAFDGPGIAFRSANTTDAFEVAQSRVNAQYNSANQNYRTPPASGRSIDHVYASPGVALRTWRLGLELTSGRFVGVIPSDHNPLTVDATIAY